MQPIINNPRLTKIITLTMNQALRRKRLFNQFILMGLVRLNCSGVGSMRLWKRARPGLRVSRAEQPVHEGGVQGHNMMSHKRGREVTLPHCRNSLQ